VGESEIRRLAIFIKPLLSLHKRKFVPDFTTRGQPRPRDCGTHSRPMRWHLLVREESERRGSLFGNVYALHILASMVGP